jgi:hypothetical protein
MPEEKIEITKGRSITKELLELIKKRIAAMPANMKIAILGKVLSKDDILKEIEEGTELGNEILAMEVDYFEHIIK